MPNSKSHCIVWLKWLGWFVEDNDKAFYDDGNNGNYLAYKDDKVGYDCVDNHAFDNMKMKLQAVWSFWDGVHLLLMTKVVILISNRYLISAKGSSRTSKNKPNNATWCTNPIMNKSNIAIVFL